MAGDPNLELSYELMERLPASGVDIIELGLHRPNGRWVNDRISWSKSTQRRNDTSKNIGYGKEI